METLRFAILQFAPRLDDPAANIERIIACGAAREVDVLVTPELSLTGYDLGDLASHLAVPVRVGDVVPGCDRLDRASAGVIAGLAERADDEVAYNALVAMKGGRVLYKHRKIQLPTYGMFDEGRFWGRGRGVDIWEYAGRRLGLIVCEDFWHPGLVYALAHRNIQILIVAAEAPGRGMRADAGPGRFASTDAWTAIARSTAQLCGIWVVLANRVGVGRRRHFRGRLGRDCAGRRDARPGRKR